MTLATPFAIGMLVGFLLIFNALRGFDTKHNLLDGKLAAWGASPVSSQTIFPGTASTPSTPTDTFPTA